MAQIRDSNLCYVCCSQRPVTIGARVVAGWDVRRLWLIVPTLTYLCGRFLLPAARVLTRGLLLHANSAATIRVVTFTATRRRHRGRRCDGADAQHKRHPGRQQTSSLCHLLLPKHNNAPTQVLNHSRRSLNSQDSCISTKASFFCQHSMATTAITPFYGGRSPRASEGKSHHNAIETRAVSPRF